MSVRRFLSRAYAGYLIRQNAGLRSFLQCSLQRHSQRGHVFRIHQLLQALEQMAFFLANMLRQPLGEQRQLLRGHAASFELYKFLAKQIMLSDEFAHERSQLREIARSREENFFLNGKMKFDLLFKLLRDFRSPGFQIGGRDGLGAVDAHT